MKGDAGHRLRLIFFGTPEFSAVCLRELNHRGFACELVVTAPDKSAGRGLKTSAPAVKQAALELGLPMVQSETLRNPELIARFAALMPDFLVVVAYGKIIPRQLLAVPELAPLNLHPSLLPRYRGAAPVNWSLINREPLIGITTMHMNEKLDAGGIYLQRSFPAPERRPAGKALLDLAKPGAALLAETMNRIAHDSLQPLPQDERLVTLAPLLQKTDGLLDWRQTAGALVARVYGLDPWPGAFTYFRGKRLKIIEAAAGESEAAVPPGTVVETRDKISLAVAVEGGALIIETLQPENGKAMKAGDFVRGYRPQPGEAFTNG